MDKRRLGPYGGGLNDLVHTLPPLISAFASEGWKVRTWLAPQAAETLQNGPAALELGRSVDDATCGFDVVDVASPPRRAAWELWRFPRMVRHGRPNVVMQFSNFAFRALPCPQLVWTRSRTYFSDRYAAAPKRGMYQLVRFHLGTRWSLRTLRIAERVICISDSHRQAIIETMGQEGESVTVSHLGICRPEGIERFLDVPINAVVDACSPPVREKLAPLRSGRRFIVVNISHYYEHKNLGDLLKATSLLVQAHADIAVVTTSGLTSYGGPHTERSRREVALARDLAERGVLMDVGPVEKSDVWRLLALADLFVFPSSLESFGHPLLEAMSMDCTCRGVRYPNSS